MNTVVAFPLHRQHKLVSGVAHGLRSRQGNDATLFWRETAKGPHRGDAGVEKHGRDADRVGA